MIRLGWAGRRGRLHRRHTIRYSFLKASSLSLLVVVVVVVVGDRGWSVEGCWRGLAFESERMKVSCGVLGQYEFRVIAVFPRPGPRLSLWWVNRSTRDDSLPTRGAERPNNTPPFLETRQREDSSRYMYSL